MNRPVFRMGRILTLIQAINFMRDISLLPSQGRWPKVGGVSLLSRDVAVRLPGSFNEVAGWINRSQHLHPAPEGEPGPLFTN